MIDESAETISTVADMASPRFREVNDALRPAHTGRSLREAVDNFGSSAERGGERPRTRDDPRRGGERGSPDGPAPGG
ncbi:hypothetical protein GCM10010151_40130 [Actinoallomurus spadix]|uniref:Uncharacterized protein n=1 Tax=Actinoallomurus spadix TaxID=79912 RepID=A0ABP3GJ28_9ACTN